MQLITCPECANSSPTGHRFCGYCGHSLNGVAGEETTPREVLFFDAASVRRKARLVLLRGNGGDGSSYYLNSEEHICGRDEGMILFPDDPTVSPRHANFYYRNSKLYLQDLGSANGSFIRLRGRIPLTHGDRFFCGEQLFEFRLFPEKLTERWVRDTCYCGTPQLWGWSYQLIQILSEGREGEVRCVDNGNLTIGRGDCDLSFGTDRFMSHYHSRLVMAGDVFYLEDTDSKNGTYYRVREEVGLQNGDYLFMGKQLIRVEIT